MSNVTIERISVDKVLYQGKTYTCNGERIMIDGQVRWLYRTRDGLDCDILVCDDRYLEEPEFTHLVKFPSGCYTVPSSGTTPKCLTFTAGEDGIGIGFVALNNGYELPKEYEPPRIEYSLDDGETWQPYEVVVTDDVAKANVIRLDTGNSVLFRGDNDTLAYYIEGTGNYVYFQAYISGSVAASGDVTSLLNGAGGDADVPEYCYSGMFSNCTGLTVAPELPATTLAEYCYNAMFINCTGLTEAPALPATTLVDGCYSYMFEGCNSINKVTCLATDISANACTEQWLSSTPKTGVFTKASSMSDWSTGISGIPSGWTVVDA